MESLRTMVTRRYHAHGKLVNDAYQYSIASMEALGKQQQSQQEQGEHPSEASDASRCIEEMVKGLMPKFKFEGEAAEIVGQVGIQPELALLCKCCGKDERKKTLICDVCENSFHLKCLKLRSSQVLLIDRWLCADCSAADGHALNASCEKSSTIKSSSRRQRHPDTQQTPLKEENGLGKIRFVLKLKTAHFKGSRALADAVARVESNRSTDESTEGCVKRPSCQMECVSYTQQSELASSPIISSHELGMELVESDIARKKKAKVSESVLDSPRDAENTASLPPPSHGFECLSSSDQHQDVSNLYVCGDACDGELNPVVNGSQNEEAKAAIDLCLGKNGDAIPCLILAREIKQVESDVHLLEAVSEEVSEPRKDETLGIEVLAYKENLERVSEQVSEPRKDETLGIEVLAFKENLAGIFDSTIKASPLSVFANKCMKQNGDVCTNDTKSKQEVQEIESSSITKTVHKIDMLEQACEHLPKRTKTQADAVVSPKLNVYVCTHERVEMDVSENRSLVKVVDDIRKGPWYKDAIELMGLEPLACSGDEAMSSKQHSQVHVRLNTWCLLQVYADCRERCIIVYDLGKAKGDAAEASQKTIDIERTWSVGGGFYVLLLGSKEAADQSVCCRIIPFRGGIGYAIPYLPSFSPNGELQDTCPLWVTFKHLPIYFYPFLQELAMALGKVLYVPRYEAKELAASPRVCVCWKVSKHVPEFLYVDMDGLGCKKLKIEFDLSLLRNLSKSYCQGDAST